MQEYKRTPRDFVEDLLTNGRTPKQIMTIARNTHWKNRLDEVKTIILEFFDKFS
jgi:hypothetical protein